jgi:hypothetical protein
MPQAGRADIVRRSLSLFSIAVRAHVYCQCDAGSLAFELA